MNQEMLESTIRIARGAGDILLRNFRQPIARTYKSSDIDFATAADQESEAYIVTELMQLYPTHHIVGEEGGGTGAPRETADFLWFVDPLDGTVNFAAGIPHFSVSIALTTPDMQPLMGVVYDPNRVECFYALQGSGAFMNGETIATSQTTLLSDAILSSGFAYDRRVNPNGNLPQWNAFIKVVRDLRRFGSAALDLAYVGSGRFDGFWERSLNPWDALAGMLIAREAGAIVTDYEGNSNPQTGADGRYLSANKALHPLMLQVLKDVAHL